MCSSILGQPHLTSVGEVGGQRNSSPVLSSCTASTRSGPPAACQRSPEQGGADPVRECCDEGRGRESDDPGQDDPSRDAPAHSAGPEGGTGSHHSAGDCVRCAHGHTKGGRHKKRHCSRAFGAEALHRFQVGAAFRVRQFSVLYLDRNCSPLLGSEKSDFILSSEPESRPRGSLNRVRPSGAFVTASDMCSSILGAVASTSVAVREAVDVQRYVPDIGQNGTTSDRPGRSCQFQ
jgi:hypothetical protein